MRRFDLTFTDLAGCASGRITFAHAKWDSAGVRDCGPTCCNDDYLLVFALEGHAGYHDDLGVRVDLEPGDALLICPGVKHTYGPPEGGAWSEFYVRFVGPMSDLMRRTRAIEAERPVYRTGSPERWCARLREALMLDAPHTPEHSFARLARLQEVLADLAILRATSGEKAVDASWLERARALLEVERLPAPSLEGIAADLHLSYVAFRKKFKRIAGIAPGRFRARHVIHRARRILEREDVKLSEIARRLGFADEYHFSRRFKEIAGVAPSQYRNRSRSM